jgi:hypothetical protein
MTGCVANVAPLTVPAADVVSESFVATLEIVTLDAGVAEVGPLSPRLSMTLFAASCTTTVPSELHTTVSVNVMP